MRIHITQVAVLSPSKPKTGSCLILQILLESLERKRQMKDWYEAAPVLPRKLRSRAFSWQRILRQVADIARTDQAYLESEN